MTGLTVYGLGRNPPGCPPGTCEQTFGVWEGNVSSEGCAGVGARAWVLVSVRVRLAARGLVAGVGAGGAGDLFSGVKRDWGAGRGPLWDRSVVARRAALLSRLAESRPRALSA